MSGQARCPTCGTLIGERDGRCPRCALLLALDSRAETIPGRMILHYRLLAKIGEGGMGVVWKGVDTVLNRDVAIKFLPDELADDPKRLARFEREARLLASLSHPNIAAVYGLHESEGGVRFLAMEFVDGEELAGRIRRGPIPHDEALEIALQIAEALESAHESGVVHRDLKPSNIMLSRDGRVQVLDFGLAKAITTDPPDPGAPAPRTDQLTREGVAFGTPAYMSPEQAHGRAVDRRTDIWAFGCVLYEMLAGRPPFTGESASDVIAAVLRTEPDFSQLSPHTPEVAVRLVHRCLAKETRRRLQSIGEARIAIEEHRGGAAAASSPATARPRPRLRERIAWVAAAAGILAALLIAAFVERGGRTPPRSPIRFEVLPPPTGGFESGIALSPDGSQLAFVAPAAGGEDHLWIRPLSFVSARMLPGTEGASFPFWSPEGDRIAFFARGVLRTIDVVSGETRTICPAPEPRGGTWSDRGLLFADRAGGEIVTVPAEGGEPTKVLASQDAGEGGPAKFPSFLPDGRRFLFHSLGSGPETGLRIGRIDSSGSTFLAPADSGGLFVSPGYIVYRLGSRLIAHRFDPEGERLVGQPLHITEDVWHDTIGTYLTAFTVSRSGHLAYRTGGGARSSLVWLDRSGRQREAFGHPGAYFEPDLSPDGRRLAVARASEDGTSTDIWLYDIARATLTRLTDGTGFRATPLWSPDSALVYYTAFPTGQVLRKDAGGTGEEAQVLVNERFSLLLDWTHDGGGLFVQPVDLSTYGHDVSLRSLDPDAASEPLLVSVFNEGGASLSPDGRWLAYQSDESGVPEIYVVSYPERDRRWQISGNGGTQPRWRGDGRELYFVAPDRKMMAVEIGTAAGFEPGLPRPLFATQILPFVEVRNHYDVARDGESFVVNSRGPEHATFPIVVEIDWMREIADR